MQPHPHRHTVAKDDEISNQSIVITAVCCLGFVMLLAGGFLIWYRLSPVKPEAVAESALEESNTEREPMVQRTEFVEGYSMVMPSGFKKESREETDLGYTIYRFRTEEGYRFTLAIIPDESISRFTSPPRDYAETLVKSVPELSDGIDGDIHPERVVVDSMSASIFRFYEKETFRGVNFTDCMVVMEPGRQLILKFAGKYGGYNEKDTNIVMQDEWYDALMSLRRIRPSESTQTQRQQAETANREGDPAGDPVLDSTLDPTVD